MFTDDINFPVRVWFRRGSVRKYTSSNYSFKRGLTDNRLISVVKAPEKKRAIVEPVITDRGSDDQVSFIEHVFFFFFFFSPWKTSSIRERDAVMDRRMMVLDGV